VRRTSLACEKYSVWETLSIVKGLQNSQRPASRTSPTTVTQQFRGCLYQASLFSNIAEHHTLCASHLRFTIQASLVAIRTIELTARVAVAVWPRESEQLSSYRGSPAFEDDINFLYGRLRIWCPTRPSKSKRRRRIPLRKRLDTPILQTGKYWSNSDLKLGLQECNSFLRRDRTFTGSWSTVDRGESRWLQSEHPQACSRKSMKRWVVMVTTQKWFRVRVCIAYLHSPTNVLRCGWKGSSAQRFLFEAEWGLDGLQWSMLQTRISPLQP